jgi:hypothetical protein
LLLLESLRGVAEERDDLLDRLLHPVELAKRRVAADHAVAEDAPKRRVVARVDELGIADRPDHPLGRRGVGARIALAQCEILLEPHLLVASRRVGRAKFFQQWRHGRFPVGRARELRAQAMSPRCPRHTFLLLWIFDWQDADPPTTGLTWCWRRNPAPSCDRMSKKRFAKLPAFRMVDATAAYRVPVAGAAVHASCQRRDAGEAA